MVKRSVMQSLGARGSAIHAIKGTGCNIAIVGQLKATYIPGPAIEAGAQQCNALRVRFGKGKRPLTVAISLVMDIVANWLFHATLFTAFWSSTILSNIGGS